jgi:hypothetical protein
MASFNATGHPHWDSSGSCDLLRNEIVGEDYESNIKSLNHTEHLCMYMYIHTDIFQATHPVSVRQPKPGGGRHDLTGNKEWKEKERKRKKKKEKERKRKKKKEKERKRKKKKEKERKRKKKEIRGKRRMSRLCESIERGRKSDGSTQWSSFTPLS